MGSLIALGARLRSYQAQPGKKSASTSALIVIAASALSAVLGFGREIILARFYGTHSEMDAFLNASTVPTVLFSVFYGGLASALIPTFSEYMSQGRADQVRHLASTVMNSLLIVMTFFAVLGAILAPFYVPLIAHGFPTDEQHLVVKMVQCLMPGIVALSLSGVAAAVLNANRLFVASALNWVVTNIVTIIGVVALHRRLGIFALVFGYVIGLFAQLAIQLPPLVRHGLYRFSIDLRHPGIARTWRSLIPIAVGSGAVQINLAFDRYFASTLPAGSTAALGYTTKLSFLPLVVVAGSIATVVFPMIASQYASNDKEAIRRSVSLALRMVTFVAVPSAVVLSVLAFPIVQTLFERGAFTETATKLCAQLVPFASVPLIALSYNTVLVQSCYACKQIKMAVTGSIVAVILNIALSATLIPLIGARGLLIANGTAIFLLAMFQLIVIARILDGFEWRTMLESISRILTASIIVGVILELSLALPYKPGPFLLERVIYLSILLTIGGGAFWGSSHLLRVKELEIAQKRLLKKFTR